MVDALGGISAASLPLPPAPIASSDKANPAPGSGSGVEGNAAATAPASKEPTISNAAQRQFAQEYANEAAKAVRRADRSFGQAQQLLTRMQEALIAIVKQYPPFQPSDAQRVSYLRSFAGLREQIDALTIPPESEWSGKIVGNVRIPDVSALKSVPNLDPAQASDAQVTSTLASVQQALTLVTSSRTDLARQVGLE